MRKLLAAAAVAVAAFVPTALPADAAPSEPAPGESLLCTVSYQSQKIYGWSGSVHYNIGTINGTCLSLSTLRTYPVTKGSTIGGPGAGDGPCFSPAQIPARIGSAPFHLGWNPTIQVDLLPVAASGAVGGWGPAAPIAGGTATLVGTCDYAAGSASGLMVMTLTV